MRDAYILSFIGGRPAWDARVRAGLVRALVDLDLTPATMTLAEEDGAQPFDVMAAIEPMDGPWPGALRLHRDGLEMVLSLGEPDLIVRLEGVSFATAAELGDAAYSFLESDFGWLAPRQRPSPPFVSDEQRALARLISGVGRGVDFERRGPGGLGIITWIGPAALAHLPHAALQGTGARVTDLPNDGARVALTDDPSDLAHLARTWTSAMQHLAPTGFFATSTIDHATGAIRFAPARWWGSPPPPPVATAGLPSDPLAKLVAAAEGRVPLSGLSAPGLAAAGARLRKLPADGLDLRGADLSGADLTDAVIVDGDLDGARLDNACFESAHLDQVSVRAASGEHVNFEGADWTSSFLEDGVLPDANFGGAALRGCELDRLRAPRADFEGALVEDCRLRGAQLEGARFDRAVLRDCDFGGANLNGASFADTVLERCTFEGAQTAGVTWPA